MSWVTAILEMLRALSAYIRYRFDPAMVERRDEINAKLTAEKNKDELDKAFADKNTLRLGYFLSECILWMRSQKQSDNSAGGQTDLLDQILPQRGRDDVQGDPQKGSDEWQERPPQS